ncbi:hypothetical protein H4217_009342, partial [Coemansia sp. RSA 1939]
ATIMNPKVKSIGLRLLANAVGIGSLLYIFPPSFDNGYDDQYKRFEEVERYTDEWRYKRVQQQEQKQKETK